MSYQQDLERWRAMERRRRRLLRYSLLIIALVLAMLISFLAGAEALGHGLGYAVIIVSWYMLVCIILKRGPFRSVT